VGRRLVRIYLPTRAQQWSSKVEKHRWARYKLQVNVGSCCILFVLWAGLCDTVKSLPLEQHISIYSDNYLITCILGLFAYISHFFVTFTFCHNISFPFITLQSFTPSPFVCSPRSTYFEEVAEYGKPFKRPPFCSLWIPAQIFALFFCNSF
jgi:hypothetical protein